VRKNAGDRERVLLKTRSSEGRPFQVEGAHHEESVELLSGGMGKRDKKKGCI